MTLLQLNYIMEIYNCGSINKAAQNLFVSQSTISSSIKELEEEINTTIFLRSNRGIEITDEGREFLNYIRPIVEQQKKIQNLYSNKKSLPESRLNISTQRYPFCAKAFVDFLENQTKGKYEFRFKEVGMYQSIEDVSQKQSEVGIVFISSITEKFMARVFNTKEVEFHELRRVPPHVFLRRDHPLANNKSIHVKQLIDYPYVVFIQNDNESLNFSEEVILEGSIHYTKLIYVNDRATVYNVISYSNAFSTGSGILIPGFNDPRVISLPLADDTEEIRIGWIKHKDRELTEEATQFISYLVKTLDEL